MACKHIPHNSDTAQTVCEKCRQEIVPHPLESDSWVLLETIRDFCEHPRDSLHPARLRGTTTVCLKCKRVVQVLFVRFADGKSADEQFQDVLARLERLDKKARGGK